MRLRGEQANQEMKLETSEGVNLTYHIRQQLHEGESSSMDPSFAQPMFRRGLTWRWKCKKLSAKDGRSPRFRPGFPKVKVRPILNIRDYVSYYIGVAAGPALAGPYFSTAMAKKNIVKQWSMK